MPSYKIKTVSRFRYLRNVKETDNDTGGIFTTYKFVVSNFRSSDNGTYYVIIIMYNPLTFALCTYRFRTQLINTNQTNEMYTKGHLPDTQSERLLDGVMLEAV